MPGSVARGGVTGGASAHRDLLTTLGWVFQDKGWGVPRGRLEEVLGVLNSARAR